MSDKCVQALQTVVVASGFGLVALLPEVLLHLYQKTNTITFDHPITYAIDNAYVKANVTLTGVDNALGALLSIPAGNNADQNSVAARVRNVLQSVTVTPTSNCTYVVTATLHNTDDAVIQAHVNSSAAVRLSESACTAFCVSQCGVTLNFSDTCMRNCKLSDCSSQIKPFLKIQGPVTVSLNVSCAPRNDDGTLCVRFNSVRLGLPGRVSLSFASPLWETANKLFDFSHAAHVNDKIADAVSTAMTKSLSTFVYTDFRTVSIPVAPCSFVCNTPDRDWEEPLMS
jgi:hypothetical protein